MNDFQLPALIVAVPAGITVAFSGVKLLKDILRPVSSATVSNGQGEWRGRMETVLENVIELLKEMREDEKRTRKVVYETQETQRDIHQSLERLNTILEER